MKKIISFVFVCLFGMMIFSCSSTKNIPEDLSAPQLLQQGQSFYDMADYKTAEAYYLRALENYGDNIETYIEVKYELAHLYNKTGNYEKAYIHLDEILNLYDYSRSGELPPAYKKLSQIELTKIPENKLPKN